jgi:hypothetical protein
MKQQLQGLQVPEGVLGQAEKVIQMAKMLEVPMVVERRPPKDTTER